MTFVIPPTLESPSGAPQLLAALGQDLMSLRADRYGDAARDDLLRQAANLMVTTGDFDAFWLGQAADAYSRTAIASRERVRQAFRTIDEGGKVAVDLASAISSAQATIFEAQAVANARAQQASLNPIPTDPMTLFGDLVSTQRAVRSTLDEAHREAAASWRRLTRSAPHYVAPKKKPAAKKRPFWKRVEGVLDKASYVPGPVGMVASGAMAVNKLAQGDLKGAAGYGVGVASPVGRGGVKGIQLGVKGVKAIHGADRVKDTSRIASKAESNVSRSVGGVGGSGHGGVNGPGGRPNKLPDQTDQAPHQPENIPKVNGARDDAGANAGNRHPGEPRIPDPRGGRRDAGTGARRPGPRPVDSTGRPKFQGPSDIQEGIKKVLGKIGSMFGLRLQVPRPQPLVGFRPNVPTIVFPAARPRPA